MNKLNGDEEEMSSKKRDEAYQGSPCIGCPRNVQKAQGVRRDGKVQCCLNEDGTKIPRQEDGFQPFRLVEPVLQGMVCATNVKFARPLIEAAREARAAAKAA